MTKDESLIDGQRPRRLALAKGPKYVREKLQGKMFLVPSFITVSSIFCGFLAIISTFHGRFEYAVKCIAIAIVLDGLDGRVARRLNATSAFGREFDSLADIVAFGVAPALLVFKWAFSPVPIGPFTEAADEFGVLVSFVFVACGATRLARFNVAATIDSGEPSRFFVGLPIPGAAAAIASVVYWHPQPVSDSWWAVVFMVCYTLIIAGLMVCTLPFFSVKRLKLTHHNQALYLAIVSMLVALIWKFHRWAFLVLCVGYAFSGLVSYAFRCIRARNNTKTNAAVKSA